MMGYEVARHYIEASIVKGKLHGIGGNGRHSVPRQMRSDAVEECDAQLNATLGKPLLSCDRYLAVAGAHL